MANHERREEKIAKDAVVEYCEWHLNMRLMKFLSNPTIEEMSPDYLLCFVEQEIVLEVITSGTGFVLGKELGIAKVYGELGRGDSEKALMKSRVLNNLVAEWVRTGQTIILMVDWLVKKINDAFFKEINEALKSRFQNRANTDMESIVWRENKILKAWSTSYYKDYPNEYSPLKLAYGPTLNSGNPALENNLSLQAQSILLKCITSKELKYQKMSHRKWLAIYNEHSVLNVIDYREAYDFLIQNNQLNNSFENIFIIIESKAYPLGSFKKIL